MCERFTWLPLRLIPDAAAAFYEHCSVCLLSQPPFVSMTQFTSYHHTKAGVKCYKIALCLAGNVARYSLKSTCGTCVWSTHVKGSVEVVDLV